jgi:hypothetical protein
MHVVAATARQAMAAGDQRMADDRVADFRSLHALADLLDPARIFVTHNVGEIDFDLAAPNAFDDVQVGAADAGAPMRTMTSEGWLILGPATSSYLTNSLAVSVSS